MPDFFMPPGGKKCLRVYVARWYFAIKEDDKRSGILGAVTAGNPWELAVALGLKAEQAAAPVQSFKVQQTNAVRHE